MSSKRVMFETQKSNESSPYRDGIGVAALCAVILHEGGIEKYDVAVRPEIRTAFDDTSELFALTGVVAPSIEEALRSGVDMEYLGNTVDQMRKERLSPQIVLTKDDLTIEEIRGLYTALREDYETPLREQKDGDGLNLHSDIIENWESLNTQDANVPRIRTSEGDEWTLRIVSGAQELQNSWIDNSGRRIGRMDRDEPQDMTYPTASEYLLLQAHRILAGKKPVDHESNTWLHGKFNDFGSGYGYAPFGYWNSGRVVIATAAVRTNHRMVERPVR